MVDTTPTKEEYLRAPMSIIGGPNRDPFSARTHRGGFGPALPVSDTERALRRAKEILRELRAAVETPGF